MMTDSPLPLQKIVLRMKENMQQHRRQRPFFQVEQQAAQAREPHAYTRFSETQKTHILPELSLAGVAPSAYEQVFTEQWSHCLSWPGLAIQIDACFHEGSYESLRQLRQQVPGHYLVAHDLVVDEYQILQARLSGADALTFSPAVLGARRVQIYCNKARFWLLEPILQIHQPQDLQLARDLHIRGICLAPVPGQIQTWSVKNIDALGSVWTEFETVWLQTSDLEQVKYAADHGLQVWVPGQQIWHREDAQIYLGDLQARFSEP